MFLTIRRPIPTLVENEGSFSPVIKDSKMRPCKFSAMPGPLSATDNKQNIFPSTSFSVIVTLIFPPFGVYLSAFERRFFKADSIFGASSHKSSDEIPEFRTYSVLFISAICLKEDITCSTRATISTFDKCS